MKAAVRWALWNWMQLGAAVGEHEQLVIFLTQPIHSQLVVFFTGSCESNRPMAFRLRMAAIWGEPALLFFNISAFSTRSRKVPIPSEQVPILKSARSSAWCLLALGLLKTGENVRICQ
jgi:hypothetical protein